MYDQGESEQVKKFLTQYKMKIKSSDRDKVTNSIQYVHCLIFISIAGKLAHFVAAGELQSVAW